jgi:hypothetical protein
VRLCYGSRTHRCGGCPLEQVFFSEAEWQQVLTGGGDPLLTGERGFNYTPRQGL